MRSQPARRVPARSAATPDHPLAPVHLRRALWGYRPAVVRRLLEASQARAERQQWKQTQALAALRLHVAAAHEDAARLEAQLEAAQRERTALLLAEATMTAGARQVAVDARARFEAEEQALRAALAQVIEVLRGRQAVLEAARRALYRQAEALLATGDPDPADSGTPTAGRRQA